MIARGVRKGVGSFFQGGLRSVATVSRQSRVCLSAAIGSDPAEFWSDRASRVVRCALRSAAAAHLGQALLREAAQRLLLLQLLPEPATARRVHI